MKSNRAKLLGRAVEYLSERRHQLAFWFWISVAIGLACTYVAWPILAAPNAYYPFGIDPMGHLTKGVLLAQRWSQGSFSDWCYEWYMGSTLSQYYPPLSNWVCGFIQLLSSNVLVTFKVFSFACLFVAGLSAARLTQRLGGNFWASLIAGVLYPTANYTLFTVLVEGTLGRTLGMPFFPLLLLACLDVVEKRNLGSWSRTAFYAFVLSLSHAMQAYHLFLFIAIFVLIWALRYKDSLRRIFLVGEASVIGVLLSAFWFIPGLAQLEMPGVPYSRPEVVGEKTADLWNLLSLQSQTGNTVMYVLAGLGIFVLWRKYRRGLDAAAFSISMVFVGSLIYGSHNPVYRILPLTQNLIPVRFTNAVVLPAAVLAGLFTGFCVDWVTPRAKRFGAKGMIAVGVAVAAIVWAANATTNRDLPIPAPSYYGWLQTLIDEIPRQGPSPFDSGRVAEELPQMGGEAAFFPVQKGFNLTVGWNVEGTPHVYTLQDHNVAYNRGLPEYVLRNWSLWNVRAALVDRDTHSGMEEFLRSNDWRLVDAERGVALLVSPDRPSYFYELGSDVLVIGRSSFCVACLFPSVTQGREADPLKYDEHYVDLFRCIVLYDLPPVDTKALESRIIHWVNEGKRVVLDLSFSDSIPEILGVQVRQVEFSGPVTVAPTEAGTGYLDSPQDLVLDPGRGAVYMDLDKTLLQVPTPQGPASLCGIRQLDRGDVYFVGAHLPRLVSPGSIAEARRIWAQLLGTDPSGSVPEAKPFPVQDVSWSSRGASFTYATTEQKPLIISITYSPRWVARVDGEPIKVYNHENLVALVLPAGAHQVTLEYRQVTLAVAIGCLTSVLALTWLILRSFSTGIRPAEVSQGAPVGRVEWPGGCSSSRVMVVQSRRHGSDAPDRLSTPSRTQADHTAEVPVTDPPARQRFGAWGIGVVLMVLLVYVGVVYINAWVGDDAYITFRTIDNFVHGYGLTWNVDERVQTYTHPLWMFFMSVPYFLTKEIYFTAIFVSMAVSAAAVSVLAFGLATSLWGALLGTTVLTLSKSFVDYSTSGLENPLTHLILGAFLAVYLKVKSPGRRLFLLSLLACLGTLNRMDTALLFAPVVLLELLKDLRFRNSVRVLAGFAPFIVWEAFSLFYYGFLFPNTAYAKLNTGISESALISQGLRYFANSTGWDPLTLGATAIVLLVVLVRRKTWSSPIALGILLYFAYIVWIGGDFMSGRFFSASMFCVAAILSRTRWPSDRHACLALIAIVVVGAFSPISTLLSGGERDVSGIGIMDGSGICDERRWYYPVSGLLRVGKPDMYEPHWSKTSVLRDNARATAVAGIVGHVCFACGPGVHVVDPLALGDALLARLPALWNPTWRIGHFERLIPEGYVETIKTGANVIEDPNLASYYDKLSLIIRGDLFDVNRFREIIKMDLGKYDGLIDTDYYQRSPFGHGPQIQYDEACAYKPDGVHWQGAGNYVMDEEGLLVTGFDQHVSKYLSVSVDSSDKYQVCYYKSGSFLGRQVVGPTPGSGLVAYYLEVPLDVAAEGFDAIRIMPLEGDGRYSLGSIRFLSQAPPVFPGTEVSLKAPGSPTDLGTLSAVRGVFQSETGFQFDLEKAVNGSLLTFYAAYGGNYRVVYFRNGYELADQTVPLERGSKEEGGSFQLVRVPKGIRVWGFDCIRVLPEKGTGKAMLRDLSILASDDLEPFRKSSAFAASVVQYSAISTPKKQGTPWDLGTQVIGDEGLRVDLGAICHNAQIEVSVDHNDTYELVFYRGQGAVGRLQLSPHSGGTGGLRVETVNVPPEVISSGYDSIGVFPVSGDGLYSVGHLRLLNSSP